MNLNIVGRHFDVTPAIRNHVESKLGLVSRHFDHVIDLSVVLSVEKLQHKVEVNGHLRGKDLHVESVETDLYAAIEMAADKLDRLVLKHKEKQYGERHSEAVKY